jgi:hypothetical protein
LKRSVLAIEESIEAYANSGRFTNLQKLSEWSSEKSAD